MKYLLVVAMFIFMALFYNNANAQEMPSYLKGATVTVTLKNGKTYEYKSEEMAVVPRQSLGTTLALQNTVKEVKRKIENKELVKNKKNRLYGLVGQGPTDGLDVSTNGSRYKVEHDRGGVLGIGYQRKLDETVNIGIQIQNNDTTSLSLGFDF